MPQQTITKLPIDEFARIFGINPLHFWQVQISEVQNNVPDTAWFQYGWQDSRRPAREAVAEAIAEAEADIERVLGYRLLPSWESEEWREAVRPSRPEFSNLNGSDVRGRRATVRASWGYFITGGIRGSTELEAGAAITWSDSGRLPASYEDTGTVTVLNVPAAVEAEEIALYYPGHGGDEEWRIRPIRVSLSGTTATITFRRELAVKETIIETLDVASVKAHETVADGTDDADFLDEVDVYRVYNDPQTQATLLWEPGGFCPCSAGCACAYQAQTACLLVRGDPRQSLVGYVAADWDADAAEFTHAGVCAQHAPDSMRLFYRAGWRDQRRELPTLQMDPAWARAVAYFAASKLDKAPDRADVAALGEWSVDLAFETGAEQFNRYRMSRGDLDNPFGTRRGAVYAWNRVRGQLGPVGHAVIA